MKDIDICPSCRNCGWEYIIIHHSLTKDSQTVSWQAIRRYHIYELKWEGIGYHFGMELVNDEYEILVGRPLTKEGAHCKGMNSKAIGICCVGNYDLIAPPNCLFHNLGQHLIIPLMKIFNIPIENIKGHRDYADKTCPGTKFDMQLLKQIIQYDSGRGY